MTTTAAVHVRTRASGPGAAPDVAARLAVAQLRALGWRVRPELPCRSGVFTAQAGPFRARADLSCAGPVDLALGGEADVQAACGLMHVHGRRYGGPTALGIAYASALAGTLAATGTLAALVDQAAGRGGDDRCVTPSVTTSVAQAALLSVGQYLAAATAADEEWSEPATPGGPPFAAADGVRFELETLDPEAWRGFWAAVGADRADAGRGWLPFQQRYGTAVCPLPVGLLAATAGLPFADLERLARETGVDLTPVAAEPRDLLPDGWPWRVVPGRSVGTARERGGGPHAGDGPLAGVIVVEVCRRVQGPLAGHLLRLLGARVVRVEPPGGDPMRGMPPMAGDCSARFVALNHGKETQEADLATASGRATVRELAAGADVFLHSLAPGKDRALGLDAEALAEVNPGLVHVAASGWGEERGERPPVGTDFPVQAWSGLAALVTPPGLPPTPSLFTLTDVLGGAVCAEGAVAGLLAARLTGRGQALTSSLLSAARMLCLPELRSPDAGPELEPSIVPCTDLADLAADPRFAAALDRDGDCTVVRSPWEFHR
ncbi:CoA transferase [Streptacidiphilus fuscans]|uniref:CoA transferase n=1 Tax=Streptacidiphilus fuscans TaxID=2789292 RepID=A0A931B9B1_9ACTN|nr:CoA transferase [Streptacidiphilus fuscans]MBF9069255.1 CoA transferase [Streptacidiphilus fuscans]